jgi:BolA family transcriptional regulator, general stress-responsive regulator
MRPSADDLRTRLIERFTGAEINVTDDSHLHAGHAGSKDGAGHYTVTIYWREFAGKSTLARHRLVYDAVKDWMPQRIHALSIQALDFPSP